MIVIAGSAKVNATAFEEARQAGSLMAATSRQESGCLDYRFAVDIDDPLVVRIFEQWESQAALDAHFAAPHFQAFSEVILRVVDGPTEFKRFEVSSHGPLFG